MNVISVIDKGRPWETPEAFQFILKVQIKALLSLGASPQLEVSKKCKYSFFRVAERDSSIQNYAGDKVFILVHDKANRPLANRPGWGSSSEQV